VKQQGDYTTLEISIIGLPKSGKTTIFNALTKRSTAAEVRAPSALTYNIGTAKVPEPRLEFLTSIFHPKKVTAAEIRYIDIAGITKGFGRSEGIGGQLLNYLSKADLLLHVVRAFRDEGIPHIDSSIDPKRDMATMNLELIFSDLSIIEKRIQRIQELLKSAKPHERDLVLKEQTLLQKIKVALEGETPIREQKLSAEEVRSLANYQFLTAKPMLVVINIDEDQISQAAAIETELRKNYSGTHPKIIAICGKLEMELAQLEDAEAKEFRNALGLSEPVLDRVIRTSYELLGLISFFTTVSEELKAWTIPKGTTALKAAGKIHSDIERGFIKAEVINFTELQRLGSLAEARRQGLLRLEGKNYIVEDGDIITFMFNV